MNNYTDLFVELGLPKNEAKLYEYLLTNGRSRVTKMSVETQIHRRNVYDSLARLIEKGYVYEVLTEGDTLYEAVNPNKFSEAIMEKKNALDAAMPNLLALHTQKASPTSVYVYAGLEGWKNYMRDILRLAQPVYTLGAKAAWSDPQIVRFSEQITKEMHKKNIASKLLYDADVSEEAREQAAMFYQGEYRLLPPQYKTSCVLDIFGDRVVVLSNVSKKLIDKDSSFTVIVNQEIADAFRTWFQFLWDASANPRIWRQTEQKD